MIVDFHTHTFPDAIAPATIDKLSRVARIHPFTDGTSGALERSMAASGVDFSILLPVATRPGQVRDINDSAAARNGVGGPLISFGCMHPDYDLWREELHRIAALGLKGIKIHPVYQGVDQDDPRYLRILELAGELDLVVVTHGGIDVGYPEAEQCTPEKIASAIRQVGPVKLVAAHMGGWKQWELAEELLAPLPGVYLDTAVSTGRMTPRQAGDYSPEEQALLNEEQFLRLVRTFGADHVLFGTDSPWSDQRASLNWIWALPLSPEEQAAILGGNAKRLLKL